MNLARKQDRTLRRRYSFRVVWLPGTDIKIGDILILKDGALVSIGNIGNEGIPFEEVTDKAGGAVVMRLFRIKRNGEIY
ncbi:MAG: hypothetical protein WDZ47_15025 [Bacteroidales bacterium]